MTNMLERTETIENEELATLLNEKEEIQKEHDGLIEKHNTFREEFTAEMKEVKERLNGKMEAVKESAKGIIVDLSEYEEMRSVEAKDDKVVINIIDKIEEFKVEYKEFKRKLAEEPKEEKK